MKGDPVDWEKWFPVFEGRVEADLFKDPSQVFEGVSIQSAHVFHEGVEDRALFSTPGTSDKHPIFSA